MPEHDGYVVIDGEVVQNQWGDDASFLQAMKLIIRIADSRNARALKDYLSSWEQSNLNWTQQRKQFPPIEPPFAWEYEIDWENRKLLYFGPHRDGVKVSERLPLPWEMEEPEPPKDAVFFGPSIFGWPGAYWATEKTTVAPGTVVVKGGVRYRLTELGPKGSLIYRKMWVPVEE